jgi:hypothetical protein
MTVTALSGPTAGDQAEEHLGQGKGRGGRRDRAIRAVQCDLEPATHRGTVDERERRHRQRGELAEHPVSEASDLEHLVVTCQLPKHAEVGTDAEDERLSGEADGCQVVTGGYLLERCLQGRQ